MRNGLFFAMLAVFFGSVFGNAAEPQPPKWDMALLSKPPAAVEAKEAKVEGVQSLFFDGLPHKGRPTKFFAYLGLPAKEAGKCPAVIVVHGGGGTAFDKWVKYWNEKGYVALSMDTEGHVPISEGKSRWKTVDSLNLPWAGQPQRPGGSFADADLPPDQQWLYHAVADCVLSVSYLASRPEVDPNRIGIVGISMGSVVCSVVGGIDGRLAFVVPQYIGGNTDLGNVWYAYIKAHPTVMRWDPANFYRNPPPKAQWLWIDGKNDKYGLPTMITKSWRETGPNSRMCLLPTQGHGHIWIETGPSAVREIYALADSVTRGAPPLAQILATKPGKGEVTLTWKAVVPVVKAQMVYTVEEIPRVDIVGESRKDWEKVKYKVEEAALPPVRELADGVKQTSFRLPEGMKAGFINLIDERGLAVTCDFLEF